MMLRVQRERLEAELGDAPGEYLNRYGLTAERLASASADAVVMHPGPMNRGVEIEDSVADDSQRATVFASSFAAALELVREGQLELNQQQAFAPLYFRKRPPQPPGAMTAPDLTVE